MWITSQFKNDHNEKEKKLDLLILPNLRRLSKPSSSSILPIAQAKIFGATLASIFSHSTSNPWEYHTGFSCKIYPDSEHFSPPPLLTSPSSGMIFIGPSSSHTLIPDLLLRIPPGFLFLPLPPSRHFSTLSVDPFKAHVRSCPSSAPKSARASILLLRKTQSLLWPPRLPWSPFSIISPASSPSFTQSTPVTLASSLLLECTQRSHARAFALQLPSAWNSLPLDICLVNPSLASTHCPAVTFLRDLLTTPSQHPLSLTLLYFFSIILNPLACNITYLLIFICFFSFLAPGKIHMGKGLYLLCSLTYPKWLQLHLVPSIAQ